MWGGRASPVGDVGGAQQGGQVGDGVAQGARLVALGLTGEEVEGDEGSVGAGEQGQAAWVEGLAVQRLLHCQLQVWGTPRSAPHPDSTPSTLSPRPPDLCVHHILLTHAGQQ